MQTRYSFVLLLLLIVLSGCSGVKAVGDGMTQGTLGSRNALSAPIAATGVVLSIGADIFSGSGIFSTTSKMDKAAKHWTKPMPVIESHDLSKLKATLAENDKKQLEAVINAAKAEAQTGRFKTDVESQYLVMMYKYSNGEWVTIGYADAGNKHQLKMWCNKQAESCILALAGEQVDLPIFKESTKTLKTATQGKKASFGTFEAYDELSSIQCAVLNWVKPTMSGYRTFTEAIRGGLKKEMLDADVYEDNSKTIITGKINKIDVWGSDPEWKFDLTLTSSNGKSLNIKEKYTFEFVFWSSQGKCSQLQSAFPAAIKHLSEKIAQNPGFAQLL